MALIWVLSSMTMPELSIEDFPFRDKGIHALEYLVLGFLVAHASFRTWPTRGRLRLVGVAFLITAGWGILDEIHQAFVPGRSTDVLDLAADLMGAFLGTSLRLAVSFFLGARGSRVDAIDSKSESPT
jgi:VanZ family protein